MKKHVILGLLAAMMVSGAAFADDELISDGSEMGDFTASNPAAAYIVTAPLRAATGGVGFAAGAMGGAFKGIATGFQDANAFARDVHDKEEGEIPEQFVRNVLYIPTVAAASAVYLPLNIVTESLTTGWDMGGRGSTYWNRL